MVTNAMTRLAALEGSIEKALKTRKIMARKVTELQKKLEISENEKKSLMVENEILSNFVEEFELLNHKI